MVQVLAIEVMVVLIVTEVKADAPSASVLSLYVVSVLILLLGKSIPRADVVIFLMISAFGEIQADAVRADGAGPPLSSTHCGLQRRCGAEEGKRYGRLCQLLSPEGPLSNRHRLPSGSSP